MARVKIEEYRGFQILFDTDKESFTAWADSCDTEFLKKTFAEAKRCVDKYLKDNQTFRPFKVQRLFDWSGEGVQGIEEPITIVGIRKDNRFITEKAGVRGQISNHDVKYYALYNPDNNSLIPELEKLRAEKEEYLKEWDNRKEAILSRVKPGRNLKEVKLEILAQQKS